MLFLSSTDGSSKFGILASAEKALESVRKREKIYSHDVLSSLSIPLL